MRKNSDKSKFQILNYKLNLERVGRITEEFEKRSVSPVLIKGLAAAMNYPKPFQRVFSDIDLAVAPEQFEKARRIIEEKNFNVDLHKGLRHLDTVDWADLYSNTEIVEMSSAKMRVLRPEDHLRVLCVHWLNDGGADRTRLWDIYFAVSNRKEDFCRKRFFDVVEDKRKLWLLTVLRLTEYYLGLNLNSFLPDSENQPVPQWVWRQVEKEWRTDERLTPLHQILGDKKRLIKQIGKRAGLNALQAVVENDAVLPGKSVNSVRLVNGLKRMIPSLKRIIRSYFGK